MEKNCNIVEDILPLYIEDMVSEDTREFVENHLAGCATCRAKLEHLQRPPEAAPVDAVPLKKLKEKLLLKRIQTIFFTTALVLAIVTSVFAIMTSPQFFPYSDDLVQITENRAGAVTITFADRVTGYSYITGHDEETGSMIYHINAWDTVWDKNFANRGEQNMIIEPTSCADIKVYYAQNDGSEDVLIYGLNTDDNAGSTTLPRLILAQYFLLAVLVLTALVIARFLFRKQETARTWLNRIVPFPVSYILAHICTKGLSFESYSAQRDFFIIFLVAILLSCAILSGSSLYKIKKERKTK